jgi:hypothetical protein
VKLITEKNINNEFLNLDVGYALNLNSAQIDILELENKNVRFKRT